jgi:hypothetical protein
MFFVFGGERKDLLYAIGPPISSRFFPGREKKMEIGITVGLDGGDADRKPF